MKQAFTLIELLVVVLIIGILSAMALAQYQRAVKRARGVEVLEAGRSISQALNLYYLANGTYIGAGDSLDITTPSLKHFKYCPANWNTCSYSQGVDSFQGCSQVGTQNCYVSFVDSDGTSVAFGVEKGKISIKTCVASSPNKSRCADYFACTEAVGSGVKTGDCTDITQ